MYSLNLRAFTLLLGLSAPLLAQAESEYEAWLKANSFDAQAVEQEFQDYIDENDKAFLGFLKQRWKKVDLETPILLDTTPKPIDLPIAKPVPSEPSSNAPIIPAPILPKEPVVKIRPTAPITPVLPIIDKLNSDQVSVAFYGHNIVLPKVNANAFRLTIKPSSKSIANHWETMSKQKHSHIINALKQQQKQYQLNDWALALLTTEYAKELGLSDINSQQLFAWFLLVKSGYDVRLAYNQNAFILMPSQQALFGVTYFTLQNKKYYAVSFSGQRVNAGRAYTYSGKHEIAQRNVDFSGASKTLPSNNKQSRRLSFSYDKTKHDITLDYDLSQVLFSNTLPQMDIQYYPQQGLPDATAQQLLNQLKPLIAGRTELDAVNLLLRFVQTAFSYKTDEQQFDQENYLLPIETLHYPYSDCEDRAAIFSWLVESLLELDAVLLDYPGHIAAAVHFNQTPSGDKLLYKGKTYTVTDPTFINAKAGMSMPQFKNNMPKILNF